MNNNQLKQLAWSAYLKGGAHEDDYETFLVWYNQQSQSLPAVEQPVLSDKIGHINCDSEALKDPEFVNAVNRMTELAYHKTAPSQPEGKTLKKLNKEIERKAETFRKSTVNQMRIEKKAYIAGAMEYANPLLHKIEVLEKKLYIAESLCKEQNKTIKMLNDALPDVPTPPQK